MGSKPGKAKKTRADKIFEGYPVKVPRIGFRYDSRPIGLALKNGYVAEDPNNAIITKGRGKPKYGWSSCCGYFVHPFGKTACGKRHDRRQTSSKG